MVTFDTVRELALGLPETEEGTSYGTPSFKVRRRLFVRLREEGVLMARIDLADKEHLIRSRPSVYFTVAHYDGYPAVLIRLDGIGREELASMLRASWRFTAPPRLAAQLEDG